MKHYPDFIDKKINLLEEERLPKMGRWEIAQSPEPISASLRVRRAALNLTVVVHQESFFIFHSRVSYPNEARSSIIALVEAIEEHRALPEILLVQDTDIFNELKPVAEVLNFEIAQASKLKAAPQVLRDMIRIIKK